MPDLLDANFKDLSNAELIMEIESIAELLAVHPGYQNAHPEHAPSPELLKEKAANLRNADRAAVNKDRAKMAERDKAREDLELFAKLPASYMSIQAILKQDTSYLQNTGYPPKKKGSKGASTTTGPTAYPSNITVQQGEETGSLVVKGHSSHPRASHDLQICCGTPTGEDSWSMVGTQINCKFIVKGLQPGQRYYFRMRSHGPGGTGPWSPPVDRIVI